MQPNLAPGDQGEAVSPLNNEPLSLLFSVTRFGNALRHFPQLKWVHLMQLRSS